MYPVTLYRLNYLQKHLSNLRFILDCGIVCSLLKSFRMLPIAVKDVFIN